MKTVVLCADDFAQNQAISQGVLHLVSMQRLSAVSCMTNSPYWQQLSSDLKKYQHQVAIGLHFNLTQNFPGLPAPYSLKKLIIYSTLRMINKKTIKDIFEKQIDLFVKEIGRLPDFIDGHQHIHQFPMIRDIVLNFAKENNCFVRLAKPENNNLKSHIINLLGANTTLKKLTALKIKYNPSFSGVYDFNSNYRQHFISFLNAISNNGFIMAHPGDLSDDPLDPIRHARVKELHYFESPDFLEDCKTNNIQIENRSRKSNAE